MEVCPLRDPVHSITLMMKASQNKCIMMMSHQGIFRVTGSWLRAEEVAGDMLFI